MLRSTSDHKLLNMTEERELFQVWHKCKVELKQLRVLLQIREKQIEDLKQYIKRNEKERNKEDYYLQ